MCKFSRLVTFRQQRIGTVLANSRNILFVVAIGRDRRDQDRLLTFVVISIAIGMLTRRRLRSRLPVARERLRFGYLSWSILRSVISRAPVLLFGRSIHLFAGKINSGRSCIVSPACP